MCARRVGIVYRRSVRLSAGARACAGARPGLHEVTGGVTSSLSGPSARPGPLATLSLQPVPLATHLRPATQAVACHASVRAGPRSCCAFRGGQHADPPDLAFATDAVRVAGCGGHTCWCSQAFDLPQATGDGLAHLAWDQDSKEWDKPFPKPPIAPNDGERCKVVDSYKLMDTETEDVFDRLCDLANDQLQAPFSAGEFVRFSRDIAPCSLTCSI